MDIDEDSVANLSDEELISSEESESEEETPSIDHSNPPALQPKDKLRFARAIERAGGIEKVRESEKRLDAVFKTNPSYYGESARKSRRNKQFRNLLTNNWYKPGQYQSALDELGKRFSVEFSRTRRQTNPKEETNKPSVSPSPAPVKEATTMNKLPKHHELGKCLVPCLHH